MKTTAIKKAALGLFAFAAFTACGSSHHDESSPNLTVTISGEGAALTGFPYPPTSPNDLSFVDGWDVRFDRILVTIDDITLSDNPDVSPTDQSLGGQVVATAKGPWAVDMTKSGPVTDIRPKPVTHPQSDLGAHDDPTTGDGSGKDPNAQALAHFDALEGNRSFDPRRRYAFGFDIVSANPAAEQTHLDAEAKADYAEMVAKGLSVLYVGSATFKGGDSCATSDKAKPVEEQYPFKSLPKTVKFRFGFKTPTRYNNCQNSDLRGRPFDGEEAQRGVQMNEHGATVAQITLHVDHPFWHTVNHDAAELYFDQMAAVASPDGTLVIDDLARLDFTSFKDAAGRALPWRSCNASKPVKSGVRAFDSGSVPVNPSAPPEVAFRNYADFVTYQQSTQGHLNANGLCAVVRRFAAPN